MKSRTLLVVTALLTAGCGATTPDAASEAAAARSETAKIVSIQEFLTQQDRIRDGIADGSFGEFSSRDRAIVAERQAQLRTLLAGVETVDELSDPSRIAVFNAQEAINGVLQRNLEDTPTCRREHTVGTLRQRIVCMTPRQRKELSENAQEAMRPFYRSTMVPPPGG